ncbi:EAL domain-containing protein [Klebsiella pneumoniae]|uniref:EAL domain-containing protein n=1 Tax=Klebsiella pneumoniae TaxID=573 RepID=UPI00398705CE
MLPLYAVNVSLLQLLEHDRGEEMLKLIARYRIAPGTLILEVTESSGRMDDPHMADVMARLRPLREAGVQIVDPFPLDDFGMGYAGLHQLQQMNFGPAGGYSEN